MAHHSDAGVDMESVVAFAGTVREFSWRNPHVYIVVEVENDTLVIDTANFEDHRSPYQIGVPSSGQKHVVERYRLSDDGTHIEVQFTLDDPEYLAEPMLHSRRLIYSPHLEMLRGDCDPESTSRFLVD